MDEKILQIEEKAVYSLRALYSKYGYLPYKMSKFEEYDLYVSNKDFLLGDGVITFNDDGGKLLALKPDVTLSILKNSAKEKQNKKVYYNETVYRKSNEGNFREIMQVGVENIGVVSPYDVFEIVLLAIKSLDEISSDYVLEISHLGLIGSIIDGESEEFKREVVDAVSSKSAHALCEICARNGKKEKLAPLVALVNAFGSGDEILSCLDEIYSAPKYSVAVSELKKLYKLIEKAGYGKRVSVDFSLTGNMKYYNGIVFNGFIKGVSERVLSGGQYDFLAKKIRGKESGAIGFAVYTDLLGGKTEKTLDFDTVVLYDESTNEIIIFETINKLISQGKTVRAVMDGQVNGRFNEIVDIRGGGKC